MGLWDLASKTCLCLEARPGGATSLELQFQRLVAPDHSGKPGLDLTHNHPNQYCTTLLFFLGDIVKGAITSRNNIPFSLFHCVARIVTDLMRRLERDYKQAFNLFFFCFIVNVKTPWSSDTMSDFLLHAGLFVDFKKELLPTQIKCSIFSQHLTLG
jgi:hypothetical protein